MTSLKLYNRPARPRRMFRSPSNPKDFVRRLIPNLGSLAGMVLVDQVIDIVKESGTPDRWILEVAGARDRGDLGPAVAHFLIEKLADSAATALVVSHPVLSKLTEVFVVLTHDPERPDGEHWDVEEWPLEWRALLEKWVTVFDELVREILLRNGECEIADANACGDRELYEVGRLMVFGADDDSLQ